MQALFDRPLSRHRVRYYTRRPGGEKLELLRAMDKFKFADAWDQVAADRDKIFPSTASKMMAEKIRRFLSRRLGAGSIKDAT
jgi:hypothetical protein